MASVTLGRPAWLELSERLSVKFADLGIDSSTIAKAMSLLEKWLSEPLYAAHQEAILAHVPANQYALLLDAFYQQVPFGTGGRRGRVGYGPNRISDITVALSVQGHCNYLREALGGDKPISIVVGYDTRIFKDIAGTYRFLGESHLLLSLTSRQLAHTACEIYAGNGVNVFVPDWTSDSSYISTPELSFLIRHFSAAGGINISASHNHPDDNGFKFFDPQGGQEVPPTDEYLASFMNDVQSVQRIPFREAVERGMVQAITPEAHKGYVALNVALRTREKTPPIKILYSPLCGTGNTSVGDVLRSAGYDVELYGPQAAYDGTFASVPARLPNPEVPEVTAPAVEGAKASGAPVVLLTDPDADRIGLCARDENGTWRYFTGNEIATILSYYLTLDKERGPGRSGFLVKTLVTTRAMDAIARKSGCGIVSDLLVGFKYIAHVLASFEKDGQYQGLRYRPKDLVIAAEESHGILLTPGIRDKDAAGGALLLCEIAAQLYAQGLSLPWYLEKISADCGSFGNAARSLVMRGIQGSQAMAGLVQSLRTDPPREIAGRPVRRMTDYLSVEEFGPIRSETERSSRNLMLFLVDGAQIVVRPSGTEPKIKVYVDVAGAELGLGSDSRAAQVEALKVANDAAAFCAGRMGFRLSESAKWLPDYVDLSLKQAFGESFEPEFAAALDSLGRLSPEERRAWLCQRLAPFGAGADPLDAAGRALSHLCASLLASTAEAGKRETLQILQRELES